MMKSKSWKKTVRFLGSVCLMVNFFFCSKILTAISDLEVSSQKIYNFEKNNLWKNFTIYNEASKQTELLPEEFSFNIPFKDYLKQQLCQKFRQVSSDTLSTPKYLLDLKDHLSTKMRFRGLKNNKMIKIEKTISRNINNTQKNSHVLIYNRVSKAGSSTLLSILRKIHYSTLRFDFETSQTFDKFNLDFNEELELLADLYNKSYYKPVGFNQHLFFIDAGSYGIPKEDQPIWINIIRKPFERFVSLFYYLSHLQEVESHQNKSASFKEISNLTLDECLQTKNKICDLESLNPYSCQYCFFCGSSTNCQNYPDKDDGLQIAKYNLESFYAFVGITEEMQKTICGLENFVPLFFQGASSIFKQMQNENVHFEKKAAYFKPVSRRAEEIIRSSLIMKRDQEFYDWALQRFHTQLRNLHLKC